MLFYEGFYSVSYDNLVLDQDNNFWAIFGPFKFKAHNTVYPIKLELTLMYLHGNKRH